MGGSVVRDTAQGLVCVAYNQAFGKGTRAWVHCVKYVRDVYSDDSPGDNDIRAPMVTCPPGYNLITCNLIADWHHQYSLATVGRDKNSCYATTDCLACKVHARCLLDADSFDREIQFFPPQEAYLP